MTYTPYETGYDTNPAADEPDALELLDDDLDTSDDDGAAAAEKDAVDEAAGDDGAGLKAKQPAKPSKGTFRRVAAKALEVQEASATSRTLAASVLGSTDDVADLAASIMLAPRGSSTPLSDVDEIATALQDAPWEAGVIATALERGRLKAVWTLLHALGVIDGSTPPPAAAKAGMTIVKGVNALTEDHKIELLATAELLKRS
ncbi:hypothetical protein [Arthrobacter sp. A2-55]|uniref:hypothetical protein n=1 Tax=Arthrobacter sp. A2-55 TaxID=2897337 RepID=UPI0021CD59B1|nr:hypothetical protein [Arthrobacter sp. A2-55]MCU6479109.1 hypothetical protein [Arthrobacter sp. A2-55]